ncbi:hypothetical protein A1OE_558 [Candidatus Endolissoclinum faulkneri L2]|uniref:Uncharacterized protein n=1 Tax=Candidatus Endolissoclinum faulkneri L2 TaxID=1193729 RepID=K7YQA3_9PROT|nr:hypothetical protein A1OE_558 [Candidatus Endolissoclinum faulkneri L2]
MQFLAEINLDTKYNKADLLLILEWFYCKFNVLNKYFDSILLRYLLGLILSDSFIKLSQLNTNNHSC